MVGNPNLGATFQMSINTISEIPITTQEICLELV